MVSVSWNDAMVYSHWLSKKIGLDFKSPYKNPLGPPDTGKPDQERVNRGGGSWTDRSGFITPGGGHNLRSASRTGDEQNSSDDHMGFRICMDYIKR